MRIEIKNFILVSSDDRFDLYEKVIVTDRDFKTKVKTGTTSEKEKAVGYSMQFETCIRYILDRTINDQDKTVDLSTYISEYKKEREIVMNLLKGTLIPNY